MNDDNKTKSDSSTKKTTSIKKAKAHVKKAARTKKTVKRTPEKDPVLIKNAINNETLDTIKDIVAEMKSENISRDKQIKLLVKEIQQGFSTQSEHFEKKNAQRDDEMSTLYQSLKNIFKSLYSKSNEQEDRSVLILKSLSQSITKDHEQTLKEVQEYEKLQDKKLSQLAQEQEQKAGRSRWIAIPSMVLAFIAIVYMFYVVNVMERAMSSMSSDMGLMRVAVVNMASKVDDMSQDTRSMNLNMVELTKDTQSMNKSLSDLTSHVDIMSKDLAVLTRSVTPTMQGMHDMMPWNP